MKMKKILISMLIIFTTVVQTYSKPFNKHYKFSTTKQLYCPSLNFNQLFFTNYELSTNYNNFQFDFLQKNNKSVIVKDINNFTKPYLYNQIFKTQMDGLYGGLILTGGAVAVFTIGIAGANTTNYNGMFWGGLILSSLMEIGAFYLFLDF